MIKRLYNYIKFPVLTLVTLSLLILLFPFIVSNFRTSVKIDSKIIDSLYFLQNIAAEKGEYPVAAILLYNDSIIGSGYNTFRSLNDPLGHAEIIALKDAFKKYYYRDFKDLNRDKLILLTTYEPCMMCKGIICNLDIRHIYYTRSKETKKQLNYRIKDLSYYFQLRKIKIE